MKIRFVVATALVAATVVAMPASADTINCAKVKSSTDECLRTGGWIETTGTDQADVITGTKGADQILGDGGNDRIDAAAGDDEIDGGDGRDTIKAGSGADIVYARDDKRDTIDCGTGKDTVIADPEDRLKNCERVTRR
jgi:Ca2+-binding RTX toxin-like protein